MGRQADRSAIFKSGKCEKPDSGLDQNLPKTKGFSGVMHDPKKRKIADTGQGSFFARVLFFFKTSHFRLLESREAKGNGPQNRPSSTNQKFIDWKLVRMELCTPCVERRRQNDSVCSASCLAHTAFPEYFSHGSFPIPTL